MLKFDLHLPFARHAAALTAALLLQACGGSGSGTDTGTPPPTGAGKMALLAGDVSGLGNLDGPRGTATFNGVQSLAMDPAGSLLVAERGNHALRRITPEGSVSTVAGGDMASAFADGPGAAGKFLDPQFVAVDGGGNAYVSDNGETIRKVTSAGVVTTLANVSADVGCPATCTNYKPLTVDAAGTVYFIANNTLRKLGTDGQAVTVVASISSQGIATPAFSFVYLPSSLVADSKGNIFIADRNQPMIRKVTPTGEMSVFAGNGTAGVAIDGQGTDARFAELQAIVRDGSDNLYVLEGNGALRKITPTGLVSTVRPPTQNGASGWSYSPTGFARDAAGSYFLSALGSSQNAPVLGSPAILKIDAQGAESAYAGSRGLVGDADGEGSAARFSDPRSPAVDPSGNVVVLDRFTEANSQLPDHLAESFYLRRITPAGRTTTLVRMPDDRDGMTGTAVDKQGNTYVGGGRRIRVVAPDGSVKVFFEGGESLPDGLKVLALDGAGSVYVAAGFMEPMAGLPIYIPVRQYSAIYKIAVNGAVQLLAGQAGVRGHADGAGSSAQFSSIGGGTLDSAGNLYVADKGNHVIRKITPAGGVSTLAGQPGVTGHRDGASAQAKFWWPVDVKADAQDNLYVADRNNAVVRKINAGGLVNTVVGTPGTYGFLPGALPGAIPPPEGVAVNGTALFITTRNGVVRVDL